MFKIPYIREIIGGNMRKEFDNYIENVHPGEHVNIAGLWMTILEALKSMPEHYEGLYIAWLEQNQLLN